MNKCITEMFACRVEVGSCLLFSVCLFLNFIFMKIPLVIFLIAALWLKWKLLQDRPFASVRWLNILCWYYLGHKVVSGTLDLVDRCLFCKWKWTAVLLLGNRIICCWSDYCPFTSALSDCVCVFFFHTHWFMLSVFTWWILAFWHKFTLNLWQLYFTALLVDHLNSITVR